MSFPERKRMNVEPKDRREKLAVPGCKSEAVTKSFKYWLLRGQYHDTVPAMLGSQMNATLNPSYFTANPVPCYCAWKSRG